MKIIIIYLLIFSSAANLGFALTLDDEKMPALDSEKGEDATSENPLTTPACELKSAMRKLWEDHVNLTRNVIISFLSDLSDTKTVIERLLKNQDDIGNAIKPYYGEEAANKVAKLLREHITIAADVLKYAKENNQPALQEAQKAWSRNADDIATFLSNANSNWDNQELKSHLQKHLDLVTAQVIARMAKDWQKDIKAHDDNHDHMLGLADTLTNGIMKQFPAKFTTPTSIQLNVEEPQHESSIE